AAVPASAHAPDARPDDDHHLAPAVNDPAGGPDRRARARQHRRGRHPPRAAGAGGSVQPAVPDTGRPTAAAAVAGAAMTRPTRPGSAPTTTTLCAWALRYALRRRLGLFAVFITLFAKIGCDLLKPWPMKLLVDHVLTGEPLPPQWASAFAWLPGADTADALLTWCVLGSVLLVLARSLVAVCG